jgi:tetratricopeptide (TPR) repeat protein
MDILTIRKPALLLTAAVVLSACQTLVLRPAPEPEPEAVAEQPEQEIEPEVVPPPDDLPASLRVRKALQMLEQGDYENARNQLSWALQEKPGLQIADNLIQQIDADPIDYLGVKNFYYKVESGDSLSIIAGKFLEDPMKFVILARYNKLENPSKLAPGDRIRVPGKMPEDLWRKQKKKKQPRRRTSPPASEVTSSDDRGEATAAIQAAPDDRSDLTQPRQASTGRRDSRPAAPPPPTLDQVLGTARKLYATGDLPGAISQLESEGGRYAHDKALQKLQTGYYREHAEQLSQQGDLEQARMMLEKVVLLDSADENAIKDLIRIEDKLEARKLYRLGSDLLSGGQVENAYEMFTQSLTYDPENTQTKQAQLACRDILTDDYHRKAMSHFRHQELDRAIVLWDKILALDPGHPLAPGYRARAMDMKQKLEKIESDQQ